MDHVAEHTASHMHDYEAHVKAVEEDLEYYRTKRLEPRIFTMLRRGVITFSDILKAQSSLAANVTPSAADARGQELEARIRALEDGLDEYVNGIAFASSPPGVDMVIEDNRKERGDYDEFFRIKKKEHPGGPIEERISELEKDLRDYQMLLDTFTVALIRRGLLREEELKRGRDAIAAPGPWSGGKIVARAWVDPEFKARLIAKGREAVRELGIPPGRLGKLGVAENTESVHNVVVCTLCSCYPYDLLGDTPWWYKQDIYKKRIIADPRSTLEEMFGLRVPPKVEVRVHDSTSDIRWMVIPRRPAGTEGMTEEELAKLVTVDSLIGAGEPLDPSRVTEAKGQERVRPSPQAPLKGGL